MLKLLLALLFVSPLTFAKDKSRYNDTLEFQGTKFVKNGEGVREFNAIIGKVSVYSAALYLEKKESDPQKILNSDGVKILRMYYIYSVSKSKAIKAWKTGFKSNCGECKEIKSEIDRFIAAEQPCASGTRRTFDFLKDKLVVYHGSKIMFESTNKEFAKMVLATWLGPKPPTEGIKKALLGLN